MIKKTKDYDLFKFRDDNREKLDQAHVQKIMQSIESRNLLEMRPILVNEKMEVIDGQHRLMAAKALGIEIYFQIDKSLTAEDIIQLNISKPWTPSDYLNFYIQHGLTEYIKLKEFMIKHGLALKVALNIAFGQAHIGFQEFRMGKFIFNSEVLDDELDICWETIDCIKRLNGFSPYTSSARFWKALLKLVRHSEFDEMRWRSNLPKMINQFTPKARCEDYLHLMQSIHNWRASTKINIMEDD